MSDHRIEWFIGRDHIWGEVTCEAPAGADCRDPYGQCNAVEAFQEFGAQDCHEGRGPLPLRNGDVDVRWDPFDEAWWWKFATPSEAPPTDRETDG